MVERGKEEKRNFKKKERNKRWEKNKNNDIIEKETIKEQKYWSKLKGPKLKSKEQRYKPSKRSKDRLINKIIIIIRISRLTEKNVSFEECNIIIGGTK